MIKLGLIFLKHACIFYGNSFCTIISVNSLHYVVCMFLKNKLSTNLAAN